MYKKKKEKKKKFGVNFLQILARTQPSFSAKQNKVTPPPHRWNLCSLSRRFNRNRTTFSPWTTRKKLDENAEERMDWSRMKGGGEERAWLEGLLAAISSRRPFFLFFSFLPSYVVRVILLCLNDVESSIPLLAAFYKSLGRTLPANFVPSAIPLIPRTLDIDDFLSASSFLLSNLPFITVPVFHRIGLTIAVVEYAVCTWIYIYTYIYTRH